MQDVDIYKPMPNYSRCMNILKNRRTHFEDLIEQKSLLEIWIMIRGVYSIGKSPSIFSSKMVKRSHGNVINNIHPRPHVPNNSNNREHNHWVKDLGRIREGSETGQTSDG